jgi:hypothetical protein
MPHRRAAMGGKSAALFTHLGRTGPAGGTILVLGSRIWCKAGAGEIGGMRLGIMGA